MAANSMIAARIRTAQFCSVALATLLLGSWPSFAHPSFHCGKATLPAERFVCASPDLSGLDEMLGRSFTVAVDALGSGGRVPPADQVALAAHRAQCLRR